MLHSLSSDFVRDQLALRATTANDVRLQPDGLFVLYWMQSTHRFEDNWALRFATLEADRLNRPLLVHQGLDPTYEHANDRIHTFILQNARALARRAPSLGLAYQFSLRRRREDDRRVVDRLAARACLVVTDLFPTAGIAERTARFAARAPCRVVAVESHAVVPAAHFAREEYAARTIRPKIAKLRDHFLQPVEDRPPRVALAPALWEAVGDSRLGVGELDDAAVAAEVARCEIDHSVPPVPTRFIESGIEAARARLDAFCRDALADYPVRRNEPSDRDGSSRLSPWLHFGQISAAEVARTALAAGPAASAGKFLDELITWRELAFNSRTHEPLWNAAQRELVATGAIHNVVRMLWGKSAILWTRRYGHALKVLIHLNNKWGIDGRDPSSFGGIQWCFGKFDRPWFDKPVWGVIRPMSLARAHDKFDARAYIARWEDGGGE